MTNKQGQEALEHGVIPQDLELPGGWDIGEATLREIVAIFLERDISRVVEYGSGKSTVRLALQFPDIEIISLEHDRYFAGQTIALCNKYQISNARVCLRELKWRRIGLGLYKTYARDELPKDIDAVIVDGPPGTVYRGREACLYDIFNNIKEDGVVILDDYNRPPEKDAVRNWLCGYRGLMDWEERCVGHGLAVLTKKRKGRRRPCLAALKDNYREVVGQLISSITRKNEHAQ